MVGSPGADHDQATLDALTAAAREHGRLSVAHAASYQAVEKAQRAGVAPKTSPEELRDRVAATQWTPEYAPAALGG